MSLQRNLQHLNQFQPHTMDGIWIGYLEIKYFDHSNQSYFSTIGIAMESLGLHHGIWSIGCEMFWPQKVDFSCGFRLY